MHREGPHPARDGRVDGRLEDAHALGSRPDLRLKRLEAVAVTVEVDLRLLTGRVRSDGSLDLDRFVRLREGNMAVFVSDDQPHAGGHVCWRDRLGRGGRRRGGRRRGRGGRRRGSRR